MLPQSMHTGHFALRAAFIFTRVVCFSVFLSPSSKEQTGEKTNNGTHYKLQLLYSNGTIRTPSLIRLHVYYLFILKNIYLENDHGHSLTLLHTPIMRILPW